MGWNLFACGVDVSSHLLGGAILLPSFQRIEERRFNFDRRHYIADARH
jgi:hypothetical protein